MSISVERSRGVVELTADERSVNQSDGNVSFKANRTGRDTARSRSIRFVFASLSLLAIAYGWHVASREEFIPKEGVGYWLGIADGTTLLFQLAYPLRKRSTQMRRLGSATSWFRLHMILGIVGPILILYHSNFSLGATNSNVALFTLLAVALSGVIGRYFYGRIHRGLYGARADLSDLLTDATSLLPVVEADVGGSRGSIARRLADFGTTALNPRRTLGSSAIGAARIAMLAPFQRIKLRMATESAVRESAIRLNWSAQERRARSRAARLHVDDYLDAVTRASGLAFYERLFAMWHVFHMPLFCLLIVTGIVHVVAVHLY